jgi:mannosyl-3-phosphoglycerate phosphatase
VLVATDLDASLLDEQTYSWSAAGAALDELRRRGGLLVLASSKTCVEMRQLASELGFLSPLIVENGGALVVPDGLLAREPPAARREPGGWRVELGWRRPALVAALAEIAAEQRVTVRGFASMDASTVARQTGLSLEAATRAMAREYDEPFLLDESPRVDEVAAAALRRGLRVTRGGRFLHLIAGSDKGRALRILIETLRAEGQLFTSLALGDSPNDAELLASAERAVIIPRASGPDPALAAAVPRASVAPLPGPAGWNAAVLTVLREAGGP